MANYLVIIVGGSSYDIEIKDLFESHNLYVEHYDARKSSSLKKQTVPKNTLGVIITVDRSHMTFGNSNELTRQLQINNIPFVFSSSNLATYNSAKLLLQKMNKIFPDNVKVKDYLPPNIQKLEVYKQEWDKNNFTFNKIINRWFEIEKDWNSKISFWNTTLENWKIYLLEWKDIQNLSENKEIKKKIAKTSAHLLQWKQEIHEFGLKIERNINFVKQWKENIEESTYDLFIEHEELKLIIENLKNLNDKSEKSEFRNWKIKFERWKENIDLWEKQYLEWLDVFPQAFLNLEEWQKAMNVWYESLKKRI